MNVGNVVESNGGFNVNNGQPVNGDVIRDVVLEHNIIRNSDVDVAFQIAPSLFVRCPRSPISPSSTDPLLNFCV